MVDAALHLHRYIEAYGLGPERMAPRPEPDDIAKAARQRVKQEQHAILYGTNNNGGTK